MHQVKLDVVLGSAAKSRELDSMILMDPFQLEILYDSNLKVNSADHGHVYI